MTISRRGFLQGTTAGLVVSFYVPRIVRAAPQSKTAPVPPLPPPNAFLRIGTDDSITVVLAHSETGQGSWTGLAMLIAEELECDWSKVRSQHAPAAAVYSHPGFGMQKTAGSSSTTSEFDRYRTVGAMAKDMLVRAAAERWKIAPAKLRVANGIVTNGKDRLTYGQLAVDAMKLAPPAKVKLKQPKDWNLIGTIRRRLDTPGKITGTAEFGIDVKLPGLRTAVVARPTAFGAKLVKFDAAAALKVPGVEKVLPTANGVAVVAAQFWAANLGRDALAIEWSKPERGGFDSANFISDLRAMVKKPGTTVMDVGEVDARMTAAKSQFEAVYEVPYLAHAAMEPLNCTVRIDGDHCEIWTGTQIQGLNQQIAAKILGTTPDKISIHTAFLGGSFGRRAAPDFVAEAVIIAKAAGVPVKVIWTRKDDLHGGYYRPAFVHRIQVGVDANGMPVAWNHVLAGQSIAAGTPTEAAIVHNGIDPFSVEGLADSPYLEGVPTKRVSLHSPKTPVTVHQLRSVGHAHTAFAMESMLDELAHAAGRDPLAYRLALLKGKPRHAAALRLAADKAGWSGAPPAGRARGLAMHESFGSIVAEVAEVSIEHRRIRVHAVTCAVDCGTAVNPLAIEAQVQGSVAFGLTGALYGKLTIVNGAVQESSFYDYPLLRISEMPRVAVHLIPSGATMGGIGEAAIPPIAPAVANAVFALTKQRLRTLPLQMTS